MNSKDRVIATINHQPTDRTPYYYFGTSPINGQLVNLIRKVGFLDEFDQLLQDKIHVIGNVQEHTINNFLGSDVVYLVPRIKAQYVGKEFSMGSIHAAIYNELGSKVGVERLPLEDIEDIVDVAEYNMWPDPDWYIYEIAPELLPYLHNRAVIAYDMGILFLYAMGMRGMEELMIDMALNPDLAHAIFEKITAFNLERTKRFLEANRGVIDIVGVGDDVASQTNLLVSPQMWQEMVRPYLEKMVALCKEYKVIPYYHGCGGFTELFPAFIEMGIQCVGKLQPEAHGNNFTDVKNKYGRDICLWGAIDGQQILVSGQQDDVRSHIRRLFAANKDQTGYVMGPSHSFTADTPVVNIISAYSEIARMNHTSDPWTRLGFSYR